MLAASWMLARAAFAKLQDDRRRIEPSESFKAARAHSLRCAAAMRCAATRRAAAVIALCTGAAAGPVHSARPPCRARACGAVQVQCPSAVVAALMQQYCFGTECLQV
jgi:hypothetical protein